MSKEVHIIYYGANGENAKAMAAAMRADRKTAQLRHAPAFNGEAEECVAVHMLNCVTPHDRARIAKVYGDKVAIPAKEPEQPPPPVIPPPPPPVIPPPPAPPAQE
jgi:hypothetical protein